MTGYLNDPEKTTEAFEFGWFHSGRSGPFDEDGYLYVVDRKKDMIKTGGENVASREVEEVLYQYPGIEEVAVIGLADPKWIEIVAAVVVPKKGASLNEKDIIAHCKERLAAFKCPKKVILLGEPAQESFGKNFKARAQGKVCRVVNPAG